MPADSAVDVSAVRRAYTMLTTLTRLQRYLETHQRTGSKKLAGGSDFVSFEVRLLKNGPIEEILGERLYDLVTPRAGDVLEVTRHTYQHNDDPIRFVSYDAFWKTEPQPEMDGFIVRQGLGEAIRAHKYDRYLQYEVTIADGLKLREYKAMALLGGSFEDGMKGTMTFVDLVVDGDSLALAQAEDLPPVRLPFLEFTDSQEYRTLVERAWHRKS